MEKTIDGLNIHYVIQGEGELVVLLHGWGANIGLFDNLISLLSTKYKVLAMDLPGFGESDEPKEAWCVDDYVNFVLEFIREYQTERVIFLGHSFGGRITIKINALDNLPFKIDKNVLVDSAGVLPKKSTKQKTVLGIYSMVKPVVQSDGFNKAFPGLMDKMRRRTGSQDYNSASPIMKQVLVNVVNEDLTPLFPLVKPSTLLVWGRNDTATPLSDAQLMEKTMPDAGLAVIDNCGHFSFLEQQAIFNNIMISFFEL